MSGLNAERKLNTIIKSGVIVYNIARSEKQISFDVDYKSASVVKDVLKEFSYTKNNSQPRGLYFILQSLRGRIGLIVGSILFVLIIIFSSSVVLDYRVQGNNFVTDAQIIDLLSQNGYNIGRFKAGINVDKIQELIVSHFDNIAFASVILKGNTIVVSIKEEKLQEEQQMLPLYAQFSGVVTKVNLQRGTLLVGVGDVVKKGQKIVEPYEVVNGKTIAVEPKAEVLATVALKGQVVYDTNNMIKGRVGKVYQTRSLEFMSLCVPCPPCGDKSVLDGEFEVEKTEEVLPTLLSIKQKRTTYYALGDVSAPDYERDKDMLERESVYLAYAQIDGNYEIISQNTQTIQVQGVYYITTYLQIYKNILTGSMV